MIADPAAPLEAYARIFGSAAMDRIGDAATCAQGARLLHLCSAGPSHHGRMLDAALPFLANLGVTAHRARLGRADDERAFAPALSSALQGELRGGWTRELTAGWRDLAERSADAIQKRYDVYVVHDPQLVGLRRAVTRRLGSRARWVWHCHFDLRDCDPRLARVLAGELAEYDLVTLEHPAFQGEIELPATRVVPPVIDPLSGRNVQLPVKTIDAVMRRLELDAEAPLAVQVSPFDDWDDPRWAMYTFEAAARLVPDLQLALVATAEPAAEARAELERARRFPGVRFVPHHEVSDVEINVLQGAALVTVQQGVRRGFSTALMEAGWKGRPVLASDGGAMSYQVEDGVNGHLFKTFDEAAQLIASLAADRSAADALGFEGHRRVRDHHLVVRWVEEYLRLLAPARRAA